MDIVNELKVIENVHNTIEKLEGKMIDGQPQEINMDEILEVTKWLFGTMN